VFLEVLLEGDVIHVSFDPFSLEESDDRARRLTPPPAMCRTSWRGSVLEPPPVVITRGLTSWGVLCIVVLIGCHDPYFDAGENLPAYAGVSSQLARLAEGEERTNALRNMGIENQRGAVVVQQIIHNESDDDLRIFRLPPFEAEMILVETAEGDRVPLSARGREFARKRRDPGRGLRKVPAHATQKYEYILSEWFDLSEPGTYTVEIESRYLINNKPELGYFETNPEPVSFEVR
jgi:hypothetical protein